MIIFNDFIPKLCSKLCGFDIAGITLFPFIILCNDERGNDTLINHESIHLQQFKETLFFGGWAIYLYDFILGYIKYRNFFKAYKMIRFALSGITAFSILPLRIATFCGYKDYPARCPRAVNSLR